MREAPVPSYRVRSAANEGSSSRMMMMAGGLAAVVGAGALLGWGITRMTANRPVPTVEADARPVKIRPDDRGGLRVANQDEIIFERRPAGGGSFEASGRLAPAAEAPNLDALRAATAPPAAAPRVAEAPPVAALPETAPPAAAPGAPAAPLVAQSATPQPAMPQAAAPPAAVPQAATPVPAAPAGPAPVAPAATARPTGSVVVQLGALDSEAGARTEWERLARRVPELMRGRTPQILRFEREDKPTMWRLRTGGFSAEAAREFCGEVRGKGGACAVIGG